MRIAIFRISETEARALDASCPHAAGPLADGILAGHHVICPLHGWKVDIHSGEIEGPGAKGSSVRTYPLELRESDVWVDASALLA